MKEQTLVQMKNNVEVLARAAERNTRALEFLHGEIQALTSIMREMPGYADALLKVEADFKKAQEEAEEKVTGLDETLTEE